MPTYRWRKCKGNRRIVYRIDDDERVLLIDLIDETSRVPRQPHPPLATAATGPLGSG